MYLIQQQSKTAGVEMRQGCRAAFKLEAGEKLTSSIQLVHRLIWTVKGDAAFSEVHQLLGKKADHIV